MFFVLSVVAYSSCLNTSVSAIVRVIVFLLYMSVQNTYVACHCRPVPLHEITSARDRDEVEVHVQVSSKENMPQFLSKIVYMLYMVFCLKWY